MLNGNFYASVHGINKMEWIEPSTASEKGINKKSIFKCLIHLYYKACKKITEELIKKLTAYLSTFKAG